MALKAGRVGVHPDDVDLFGKIKFPPAVGVEEITTQTTPAITLGTGVTELGSPGDNVYIRKYGPVYCLKVRVEKTLTLGSWNTLCTLPVGWRPDTVAEFVAGDDDKDTQMNGRVLTTGEVNVYPVAPSAAAKTKVYGDLVFILK